MKTVTCILAILLVGCGTTEPDVPDPEVVVSCGHAHNDYVHDRPLLEALERGMCSIEVDIWLEGGELLVAHDLVDVDPARTIQSLYLDPLRESDLEHPVVLLIDVKSDSTLTYPPLHDVLAGYADILTQWDDGVRTERDVTAIISGSPDVELMAAQSTRFAAADGRFSHLESNDVPVELMPLVSDNWLLTVAWAVGTDFSDEMRERLDGYVADAHAQGRQIRFWASWDHPTSWEIQRQAGVDYLKTDDLAGLESFLAE